MASGRKRRRMSELADKVRNDEARYKQRKLSNANNEHCNKIISRLDAKHYDITYIVGESGIGKTTLLNKLHQQRQNNFHILNPNKMKWNEDESVVSHFKNHHNLLNYVGLGSIRSRLSNFQNLSEGEKYRVITARLIKDALYSNRINPSTDYLVLDEFTSVLDRDTSKSLSYSISKFVRSKKKNSFQTMCRIILCSAHCDVIPYLQPDLVMKLNKNGTIQCIENPKAYKSWPNVDTKAILNFNELPDLKDWKQNKLKIESIHTHSNSDFDKNRNWKELKQTFKLRHKVKVDQWTKAASLPFDYKHDGINQMELVKVTKSDIVNQCESARCCIIYGPSGSGKTTTAKRLFDEYDGDHSFGRLKQIYSDDEIDEELYNAVEWTKETKVWEKMICTRLHQIEILNAVNLDSSFLQRKYCHLSVGEQHRVEIAVTLSHVLKDINNKNKWYIIDEFTSFLDRECAIKCAIGINDFIHRYDLKNIAILTCHYDVVQWIEDSIIIDLMNRRLSLSEKSKFEHHKREKYESKNKECVEWNTEIFNRPRLRIHVKQAKPEDFNPIFGIWHYKTKEIETRALCLGAFVEFNDEINGKSKKKLVGFTSILSANPFEKAKKKRFDYSLHRTVVLPQLNGLGIGSRISECFAEYLLHQRETSNNDEEEKESLILHSKTAHPFYGKCRMNNILWKALENCGTEQVLIGMNYSKNKEKENKAPNMKKKEKSVPKIYYNFHYHSLKDRTPHIQKKLNERLVVIKKNSILQKLDG